MKIKYYFVYKTTNLLNGKIYIGQHSTFNKDDKYIGSGEGIRAAIEKYGSENFKREIIAFVSNREELNYAERFFIKYYRKKVGRKMMYNKDDGGNCRDDHWFNDGVEEVRAEVCPEGFVPGRLQYSEETIEKLRQANLGEKNAFYGKTHSEETRKRLSEAAKNRTEEHTRKINEAKAGKKFFNNGVVTVLRETCPEGFVPGRPPMSEETKEKLSAALKGRTVVFTDEHRNNISKALKGKKHTKEHRDALSKALKGKSIHTDEWKKENSERTKGTKWFNNGEKCIMSKECPEGFVPGRLKFKKKDEEKS